MLEVPVMLAKAMQEELVIVRAQMLVAAVEQVQLAGTLLLILEVETVVLDYNIV
jgi:hypothetical protein